MVEESTIVAFATPVAESAIAVLRISGALAGTIAREAFGRAGAPAPRIANFGQYRDRSNTILDDCLYTYFHGKASYTGEDSLEISCHGNPFIGEKILADLIARGCRHAEPGEFTRRAFLNGKMDLTQAEAVADIITARSARALQAAQKLHSGTLGAKISAWNEAILQLLAEIEAQIDFSDEEVPEFHAEHFSHAIQSLIAELHAVEQTARYAATIHEGVNMVIFGAPNAGKSSLLNALIGEERALVSEEAGTTRDFISENITLGAHRIRIVDTAGIRENAGSKLEKLGIERAIACMAKADFYLFVIDTSTARPALPENFKNTLLPENTLLIFNKNDLPAGFETKNWLPEFDRISLSLLTPNAAGTLKEKIIQILETKQIVPASDVLIVGLRHAQLLRVARKNLIEASEMIGKIPLEFTASRLRSTISELAEILGNFDNEKVLDKVFAGFCIGK